MNANITTAIINRMMLLSESEKDFGQYEIPNSIYASMAYCAHLGDERFTFFTESEAHEESGCDSAERYYDVAFCATNNGSVCIPLPLLTPAAKVRALAIQVGRQRHDRRTTEPSPDEVADNAAEWEAIVQEIGADFVQDARIWALDEATTSGYALVGYVDGLDIRPDLEWMLRGVGVYATVAEAVFKGWGGENATLVWVERRETGEVVQFEAHTPRATGEVLRKAMRKWDTETCLQWSLDGAAEAFISGTARQSAAALCGMLNVRAVNCSFPELGELFTMALRARKRAAEFGSFFGGDADEAFWEVFQDTSYYPKEVMGE